MQELLYESENRLNRDPFVFTKHVKSESCCRHLSVKRKFLLTTLKLIKSHPQADRNHNRMKHDSFCAVYGEMHTLFSHQLSTHTLSINTALESPETARTRWCCTPSVESLQKVNTDPSTSPLHLWIASRLVKISFHVSPSMFYLCIVASYIISALDEWVTGWKLH